ncbi:MAG: hypothetical protein L0191_18005 [Acidobacteria bacterium]|nr:hypothetical protein [Acidobacteriota bacterium]
MNVHRSVIGAWLCVGLLCGGSAPGLAAEESGLGVKELLLALRREIGKIESEARKSGKRNPYQLGKVSLRIQFVMVRETEPDGTSHLKVVPVEVGHDYPAGAIHVMTLQVEPAPRIPTRFRRPEKRAPGRRQPPSEPRERPQEAPQQEPKDQEPKQQP